MLPLRFTSIALAVFAATIAPVQAEPVSLDFENGTVVADGVPGSARLSLHLVDPQSGEVGAAILADVSKLSDGRLKLTPRFKLVAGSTYRANLSAGDRTLVEAIWKVPSPVAAAPVVTSIHPLSSKLPANLLKFYLTFSEPMRQSRDIFDHVHLEDESGKRVEAPWRRQELWSDDHRRLTLWIHPGRVKQGVNLRTTMGPVLRPDGRYTLVIDSGIASLPGMATAAGSRKVFTTSAEDHQRPSAADWKLKIPPIGSRHALVVESPEALDHALAARYLTVTDASGKPVAVKVSAGEAQRLWVLTPTQQAWRDEVYTLHAGEFLEDLAGNTPTRVFDTDLSVPVDEATDADLKRQFRPLAAADR